jgi:hypothetical protein
MILTYDSSSVQAASVCPLVDLRHHSCFQHVSSSCYTRLADRLQIDSYVLMSSARMARDLALVAQHLLRRSSAARRALSSPPPGQDFGRSTPP